MIANYDRAVDTLEQIFEYLHQKCKQMNFKDENDPIIEEVATEMVKASREDRSLLIRFEYYKGGVIWNFVRWPDTYIFDTEPWKPDILSAFILYDPIRSNESVPDYIRNHMANFRWSYLS